MDEEKVKAVANIQKEIDELEDTVNRYQKIVIEKKSLIAALSCGFGVGDIVTDGHVTFLVKGYSGSNWKGYRLKINGEYSENEEYIKGEFQKKKTPEVEINKEP